MKLSKACVVSLAKEGRSLNPSSVYLVHLSDETLILHEDILHELPVLIVNADEALHVALELLLLLGALLLLALILLVLVLLLLLLLLFHFLLFLGLVLEAFNTANTIIANVLTEDLAQRVKAVFNAREQVVQTLEVWVAS